MKAHVLAAFVAVTLVAHTVWATDEAATIEAQCAKVTQASEKSPPLRIVADFSDASDSASPPLWRLVANIEELRKESEQSYPYSQAFLWSDQEASLVETYDTSPSGDWAQTVDYCFGKGGRLLRMVGTLNTFHTEKAEPNSNAGVSRIKTSYFGVSGKVISSATRVLDLETKRPEPLTQFMDMSDPVYLTLESLPFKGLLIK